MVVRFVCVIRVPVCARVSPCVSRVSRHCPGSPGVFLPVKRHRGEPGHTQSFYRYRTQFMSLY